MRIAVGLVLLGCSLAAAPARAGESEVIPVAELPDAVLERLGEFQPDVEVLDARRETEGGTAFFVVGMSVHGRRVEYYVSSRGGAIVMKTNVWAPNELLEMWWWLSLFLLAPGVIGGAVCRSVAQTSAGVRLSVGAEWLAAWCGAGAALVFLMLVFATNSRRADTLVLCLHCLVWSCLAATVVEVVGLGLQSVRGYRALPKRQAIGLGVLTLSLLLSSVAVDGLGNHRLNLRARAIVSAPH